VTAMMMGMIPIGVELRKDNTAANIDCAQEIERESLRSYIIYDPTSYPRGNMDAVESFMVVPPTAAAEQQAAAHIHEGTPPPG